MKSGLGPSQRPSSSSQTSGEGLDSSDSHFCKMGRNFQTTIVNFNKSAHILAFGGHCICTQLKLILDVTSVTNFHQILVRN